MGDLSDVYTIDTLDLQDNMSVDDSSQHSEKVYVRDHEYFTSEEFLGSPAISHSTQLPLCEELPFLRV